MKPKVFYLWLYVPLIWITTTAEEDATTTLRAPHPYDLYYSKLSNQINDFGNCTIATSTVFTTTSSLETSSLTTPLPPTSTVPSPSITLNSETTTPSLSTTVTIPPASLVSPSSTSSIPLSTSWESSSSSSSAFPATSTTTPQSTAESTTSVSSVVPSSSSIVQSTSTGSASTVSPGESSSPAPTTSDILTSFPYSSSPAASSYGSTGWPTSTSAVSTAPTTPTLSSSTSSSTERTTSTTTDDIRASPTTTTGISSTAEPSTPFSVHETTSPTHESSFPSSSLSSSSTPATETPTSSTSTSTTGSSTVRLPETFGTSESTENLSTSTEGLSTERYSTMGPSSSAESSTGPTFTATKTPEASPITSTPLSSSSVEISSGLPSSSSSEMPSSSSSDPPAISTGITESSTSAGLTSSLSTSSIGQGSSPVSSSSSSISLDSTSLEQETTTTESSGTSLEAVSSTASPTSLSSSTSEELLPSSSEGSTIQSTPDLETLTGKFSTGTEIESSSSSSSVATGTVKDTTVDLLHLSTETGSSATKEGEETTSPSLEETVKAILQGRRYVTPVPKKTTPTTPRSRSETTEGKNTKLSTIVGISSLETTPSVSASTGFLDETTAVFLTDFTSSVAPTSATESSTVASTTRVTSPETSLESSSFSPNLFDSSPTSATTMTTPEIRPETTEATSTSPTTLERSSTPAPISSDSTFSDTISSQPTSTSGLSPVSSSVPLSLPSAVTPPSTLTSSESEATTEMTTSSEEASIGSDGLETTLAMTLDSSTTTSGGDPTSSQAGTEGLSTGAAVTSHEHSGTTSEKTTPEISQMSSEPEQPTSGGFSTPQSTTLPPQTSSASSSTAQPVSRSIPAPTRVHPMLLAGLGCPERCPPGALVGKDCCYVVVPYPFRKTYQGTYTYCQRNWTGHYLEDEEFMEGIQILRPWLRSLGEDNEKVYVGRNPFYQNEEGRMFGLYANLSKIGAAFVPTEKIRMLDEVAFTGICKIPQFCGLFPCSMEPLYNSLRGQLPLPMPPPVSNGTVIQIMCNSPSTSLLALRCDTLGKLNPRPGTTSVTCKVPRTFNTEKNTTGNSRLRPDCNCHPQGTSTCERAGGDKYLCQCKSGWRKFACWKSPDMCWHAAGTPNKCRDRGKCSSFVDDFSCTCDYGFGGRECEIWLQNVSWMGTPETTAFIHPGSVATTAIISTNILLQVLKTLLKLNPNSRSYYQAPQVVQDPLEYYHSSRMTVFSLAGIAGIWYGHPNWTEIGLLGCRLIYFLVMASLLIAHWLAVMEAWTVCSVYFGIGRNRWSLAVEEYNKEHWHKLLDPKEKWYLKKSVMFIFGSFFWILFELILLTKYYTQIPNAHTCLGRIIALDHPVTVHNLDIMGMLAVTSFGLGLFTQIIKRMRPELMAEQRNYFETFQDRHGVEVLDKVVRAHHQQIFAGPALFLSVFVLVLGQDSVAYSGNQTIIWLVIVPVVALNVLLSIWNFFAFDPDYYGLLMKTVYPAMPRLPIWTPYTPYIHGYLSPEEIINRKKPEEVLPINSDWKAHPSEENYVSTERRHQANRRLTRSYLELKLQGVEKNTCISMVQERFLLAIPDYDTEQDQWLHLLNKWTEAIDLNDKITWNIPRRGIETDKIYYARVLEAPMLTKGQIIKENMDWDRLELLYYLMGHYALTPTNNGHRWPQVRHWHQHENLMKKWIKKRDAGSDETRRKTMEKASKLAPELFGDPPDQTELAKFPGASRRGRNPSRGGE